MQVLVSSLHTIAAGLNIEGCSPAELLPSGCSWYNILQVIDEPLLGTTFDSIMDKVKQEKLNYIEEAVGIDINKLINIYVGIINRVKEKHKNILVHVHQYEGTTKLNEILQEKTGIRVILDKTNFFESPTNYQQQYPNIDALISLSQCAGFGNPPGTFLIPTGFLKFDVISNVIYMTPKNTKNRIKEVLETDFKYIEGQILTVNDLWNPDPANLGNVTINY